MGRPKKNEEEIEDEDFDGDGGSNGGGITDPQLKKAAKEHATLKSKMDDARSPMGQFFKDFEEKGGHKLAFKIAQKIADMESIKAQDFWRSLERYCDVLGIFAQHDLLDDLSRPAKAEAKEPPKMPAIPAGSAAH